MDFSEAWPLYQNVQQELKEGFLCDDECRYLAEYYQEVGLLRRWRKAFLMEGRQQPMIVDLGCGTGTQSIYFALKGARVAAIDMDETALVILRKRKEFYERR
jgi:predicted RNA methylase